MLLLYTHKWQHKQTIHIEINGEIFSFCENEAIHHIQVIVCTYDVETGYDIGYPKLQKLTWYVTRGLTCDSIIALHDKSTLTMYIM